MWIETTKKQWIRADTIEFVWGDDYKQLYAKCANGIIHCMAQYHTKNGIKLFVQIINHPSRVMVYQDDLIQGGIRFESFECFQSQSG